MECLQWGRLLCFFTSHSNLAKYQPCSFSQALVCVCRHFHWLLGSYGGWMHRSVKQWVMKSFMDVLHMANNRLTLSTNHRNHETLLQRKQRCIVHHSLTTSQSIWLTRPVPQSFSSQPAWGPVAAGRKQQPQQWWFHCTNVHLECSMDCGQGSVPAC